MKSLLKKARLRLLKMHYENKVGHIGGNLSSLDLMVFLHHSVLKENDTFVLSKGHSAGALYIALWAAGKLEDNILNDFHKDNVKLAGHPVAGWHQNILFSTGSLGHGVGLATGRAHGKFLLNDNGRVFCLSSDGEWQEGSNWEALIYMAHQKLSNLTIFIDANGLQGFGSTIEVASLEPLINKFQAFNVHVQEIDGHNLAELEEAISLPSDKPKIIILRTVKGKGVSFMENRMEWHYLPLTDELYRQAVSELEEQI